MKTIEYIQDEYLKLCLNVYIKYLNFLQSFSKLK